MTKAAHVRSAALGTWMRGSDMFLWLYRVVARLSPACQVLSEGDMRQSHYRTVGQKGAKLYI